MAGANFWRAKIHSSRPTTLGLSIDEKSKAEPGPLARLSTCRYQPPQRIPANPNELKRIKPQIFLGTLWAHHEKGATA
jgi:hypothetical protein